MAGGLRVTLGEGLAWMLWLPVIVSVLYWVCADRALAEWFCESTPMEPDIEPLPSITFFRPLKRGVPSLEEKLVRLIQATRRGDQILIGAEQGSDALSIAEEVRKQFLDADIQVIDCQAGVTKNPKISKLVQLQEFARHERWLLSDSETMMSREFLDQFRREWKGSGAEVLTAPYRFVGCCTWAQRLDAIAVLLALLPGLAVVRRYGSVRLTLGACTGFTRESLLAVGGWSRFGEDLAEDHRIGELLSAHGDRVRLSNKVVDLESDRLSWRDYWRHQRRVAVTYRVAAPAGFFGMIFVHGLSWAFAAALVMALQGKLWGWGAFGVVVGVRYAIVARAGGRLRFPVPGLFWAMLAGSAVETVCWGLSWCSRRVWWAGRWWTVSGKGRLT